MGFPFTVKLPVPNPQSSRINFKLFNGKKGYTNGFPHNYYNYNEGYFDLEPYGFVDDGSLVDEVDKNTPHSHPLVHLRKEFEKSLSSGDGSNGDVTLIAYSQGGDKIIYKFSPFHSSWIEILKNCN